MRSVCTSADVFVTSCVTSMRTHSWCSPLSARARALRCAGVRDQASRGALHARMCTPIRTYTKYIGTHSLNPPHRQHKSFCTRADIYVVDVSCARTWGRRAAPGRGPVVRSSPHTSHERPASWRLPTAPVRAHAWGAYLGGTGVGLAPAMLVLGQPGRGIDRDRLQSRRVGARAARRPVHAKSAITRGHA